MSFLKEFKEFAVKGNVIDLSVGVIIGGAFGKIVNGLVENVFNPIVSVLTGGINLNNRFLVFNGQDYATLEEVKKAGVAYLGYGALLQSIIEFIIVAFAIFLFIKAINRYKSKLDGPAAAAPAPTPSETLLTEIRDLLKQK